MNLKLAKDWGRSTAYQVAGLISLNSIYIIINSVMDSGLEKNSWTKRNEICQDVKVSLHHFFIRSQYTFVCLWSIE